mmetsp:Transcript_5428/g.8117  ORF Transcript_5428/g.8117 Transcript_5428/m.8117 type:complete len:126 (-) Transcript_5428:824-1201(-)
MALSSGLYLEPSPVDASYIGTVSTSAKDIAPRNPAKMRTICILPSTTTPVSFPVLAFGFDPEPSIPPQTFRSFRVPALRIILVSMLDNVLEKTTVMERLNIHAATAIAGRTTFQWYLLFKRNIPR